MWTIQLKLLSSQKMEAPEISATCPKSESWMEAGLGQKPGLPTSPLNLSKTASHNTALLIPLNSETLRRRNHYPLRGRRNQDPQSFKAMEDWGQCWAEERGPLLPVLGPHPQGGGNAGGRRSRPDPCTAAAREPGSGGGTLGASNRGPRAGTPAAPALA